MNARLPIARILSGLREASINVHEVHNIMFEGAKVAVARLQLNITPPKSTLENMARRKDEIIQIRLVRLQENP